MQQHKSELNSLPDPVRPRTRMMILCVSVGGAFVLFVVGRVKGTASSIKLAAQVSTS